MHETNEYIATKPQGIPIITGIDANTTPIANRHPYTGNNIDHNSNHSNHSRENLMTMLQPFDNIIQQTHQGTQIFTRHQADSYTQLDYITTPPDYKSNTPTILDNLPEGNPLRESDHYLVKQRIDIPTQKQFKTKIARLPPSLKGWETKNPKTLHFFQRRTTKTSRDNNNNNQHNLEPELVRIARTTPHTTTRTREKTPTQRNRQSNKQGKTHNTSTRQDNRDNPKNKRGKETQETKEAEKEDENSPNQPQESKPIAQDTIQTNTRTKIRRSDHTGPREMD